MPGLLERRAINWDHLKSVRAELVEAPFFLPAPPKERTAPFDCLPRQALRTGFDKLRANGA
jgi:hypothetical protein